MRCLQWPVAAGGAGGGTLPLAAAIPAGHGQARRAAPLGQADHVSRFSCPCKYRATEKSCFACPKSSLNLITVMEFSLQERVS